METEINHKLAFLDILVTNENGKFITNIHRKSTFTGLFLNFSSFVPNYFKFGLISTLVDRAYKICCNKITFDKELVRIREFLGKNLYPPHLIDKTVKKYFKSKTINNSDVATVSYFKLPYIGPHSRIVQNKISHFASRLCKDTNIRLIFTTKKLSAYSSSKDPVRAKCLEISCCLLLCIC